MQGTETETDKKGKEYYKLDILSRTGRAHTYVALLLSNLSSCCVVHNQAQMEIVSLGQPLGCSLLSSLSLNAKQAKALLNLFSKLPSATRCLIDEYYEIENVHAVQIKGHAIYLPSS